MVVEHILLPVGWLTSTGQAVGPLYVNPASTHPDLRGGYAGADIARNDIEHHDAEGEAAPYATPLRGLHRWGLGRRDVSSWWPIYLWLLRGQSLCEGEFQQVAVRVA